MIFFLKPFKRKGFKRLLLEDLNVGRVVGDRSLGRRDSNRSGRPIPHQNRGKTGIIKVITIGLARS